MDRLHDLVSEIRIFHNKYLVFCLVHFFHFYFLAFLFPVYVTRLSFALKRSPSANFLLTAYSFVELPTKAIRIEANPEDKPKLEALRSDVVITKFFAAYASNICCARSRAALSAREVNSNFEAVILISGRKLQHFIGFYVVQQALTVKSNSEYYLRKCSFTDWKAAECRIEPFSFLKRPSEHLHFQNELRVTEFEVEQWSLKEQIIFVVSSCVP